MQDGTIITLSRDVAIGGYAGEAEKALLADLVHLMEVYRNAGTTVVLKEPDLLAKGRGGAYELVEDADGNRYQRVTVTATVGYVAVHDLVDDNMTSEEVDLG
jgi:hypothetical protein